MLIEILLVSLVQILRCFINALWMEVVFYLYMSMFLKNPCHELPLNLYQFFSYFALLSDAVFGYN